jgi:hypothetical protein
MAFFSQPSMRSARDEDRIAGLQWVTLYEVVTKSYIAACQCGSTRQLGYDVELRD